MQKATGDHNANIDEVRLDSSTLYRSRDVGIKLNQKLKFPLAIGRVISALFAQAMNSLTFESIGYMILLMILAFLKETKFVSSLFQEGKLKLATKSESYGSFRINDMNGGEMVIGTW